MEKIYNKLKRHTIQDLKAQLDGRSIKRCKTKDDYISQIINKTK